MKNSAPKSFIQIHYHNRPCGVTKVMERYAEAFNRTCHSSIKRNLIICNNDYNNSKRPGSNYEVLSIKEFEYHEFHTKKAFLSMRERLFKKLEQIIINKNLPEPICIVGHNLSLGKNSALSAAYADIAKKFQSDKGMHFYSVIHDMAEEGRVKLLIQIRNVESLGIPVWNYLYPKDNLQYVVLNKRNYKLFRSEGLQVSLLPNPLDNIRYAKKLSKNERYKIDTALNKLSKRDNTHFKASERTYFYPVRIISRKNVLEAVIIACVINKGNLLIGGPGTSGYDKKLFEKVRHISQRYNLPVVFDVERIREYLPQNVIKKRGVFELLYDYSDLCITTSIVEGFGYALYEPWLYGKEVTGRLPIGISKSEIINCNHLYNRFDIPLSWISLKELISQYYYELKEAFGKKISLPKAGDFKKDFIKSSIRHGYIDFGILNQEMQFKVFEKLCLSNNDMYDALKYLKNFQIKNNVSSACIRNNKYGITNKLAGRSFEKKFKECFYYVKPGIGKDSFKSRSFIHYFSSLSEFRLLMSNS